jgi:hypothetical protein
MKRGLVLESGAMRGLFTSGIIDVMMEHDLWPDGLVGVSAGAAFGCNYKSRQPGRAIRYNMRFARDARYSGLRSLLTTGDYFTANQSYVLYGDKFLLVDTDGGIAPHRCLLTLTSPAGARRLNIILDDGSLPSKVLSVESEEKTDDWYTIDGRKLSQQPTKKGLYIHNGKKTVIR